MSYSSGLRKQITGNAALTYENIAKFGMDPSRAKKERVVELFEAIQQVVEKEATDEVKHSVRRLFFDHLAQLSEDMFDRACIEKGSTLEDVLMQEFSGTPTDVKKAREEYMEAEKKQDKKAEGEALLNLVEAEAAFAMKLGVRPEMGGGSSTSYFLRDLSGSPIAIFKPDIEGPGGKENPKIASRVGRAISSALGMNAIRQLRQRVGEEATYKMSLRLESAIVPPTRITTISDTHLKGPKKVGQKRGSLQVLIKGGEEASKYFDIDAKPTWKDILEYAAKKAILDLVRRWVAKYLFQKSGKVIPKERDKIATDELNCRELFGDLALLDFLTGQIDRHYENFLIHTENPNDTDEKTARVDVRIDRLLKHKEDSPTYIIAIDNGAGFPKGQVGGRVEGRYQYCWADLDIRDEPFHSLFSKKEAKEKRELLQQIATPKTTKEGRLAEESLLSDFFNIALEEDFSFLKEEYQNQIEKLILQYVQQEEYITNNGRIRKMPSEKELIGAFRKDFGVYIDEKILEEVERKVAKTVLQILGMRERAAVLQYFLQPPEGYKDQFTVHTLAKLKTQQDFARVWKSLDKIQRG